MRKIPLSYSRRGVKVVSWRIPFRIGFCLQMIRPEREILSQPASQAFNVSVSHWIERHDENDEKTIAGFLFLLFLCFFLWLKEAEVAMKCRHWTATERERERDYCGFPIMGFSVHWKFIGFLSESLSLRVSFTFSLHLVLERHAHSAC